MAFAYAEPHDASLTRCLVFVARYKKKFGWARAFVTREAAFVGEKVLLLFAGEKV